MPDHAFQVSAPTTMPRPADEASPVPAGGLPNCLALGPVVERQLAACRRNGTTLALVSMRLRGLEAVRQRHGEAIANEVLHAAWNRLRSRLRGSDVAVPGTNDEFGAILLNSGEPAAALVDARLADALGAPYGIGALQVVISVHTGVAVYPEAGRTADALVDAAMPTGALSEAPAP